MQTDHRGRVPFFEPLSAFEILGKAIKLDWRLFRANLLPDAARNLKYPIMRD